MHRFAIQIAHHSIPACPRRCFTPRMPASMFHPRMSASLVHPPRAVPAVCSMSPKQSRQCRRARPEWRARPRARMCRRQVAPSYRPYPTRREPRSIGATHPDTYPTRALPARACTRWRLLDRANAFSLASPIDPAIWASSTCTIRQASNVRRALAVASLCW